MIKYRTAQELHATALQNIHRIDNGIIEHWMNKCEHEARYGGYELIINLLNIMDRDRLDEHYITLAFEERGYKVESTSDDVLVISW